MSRESKATLSVGDTQTVDRPNAALAAATISASAAAAIAGAAIPGALVVAAGAIDIAIRNVHVAAALNLIFIFVTGIIQTLQPRRRG